MMFSLSICVSTRHAVSTSLLLLSLLLGVSAARAQGTSFTYQGRLTDGGAPANNNYDLQFTLWDAAVGGAQQPQPAPPTLAKTNVAVTGGVFSVLLDFGVSAFPGADRFLELGVRPAGSAAAFTLLSPRQQISSTPYALRTLSATAADSLSNACVRCVQDAQINSVSGSKVIGPIPAASLPPDSASYIQNRMTPQASSNFNISGSGVIGGDLTVAGKLNVNISGNFIQNGTTLQNNANFNISGTGLIGGKLGIGTSFPAFPLEVLTPLGSYGFVHSTPTNGVLHLRPIQVGSFAGAGASGGSGGWLGTLSPDPLYFFVNNGGASMAINIDGKVGIGTISPTSRLEVAGHDVLKVIGDQPFITLTDTSAANRKSFVQNKNGDLIFFTNTQQAMQLKDNGHVSLSVLEIQGGADLAENFEVDSAKVLARVKTRGEIKPGLLVSIDPLRRGKLAVSGRAYDRRVAGIISGAGGINAGMVMGQSASADDKRPIALSGRVYCWADAANGPIKPGDLLTTSSRPGYAMKVSSSRRARGAIVGKAMTSLKSGSGLVLVLVSLQ